MVRKDEVKYSDHNNEHEPADDIKSTPPAAPPHNTICDHICKGLCDLGIQRETMKGFTAMTIIIINSTMCANGTFSTTIMWEEITTYKLPGEKDTTPGLICNYLKSLEADEYDEARYNKYHQHKYEDRRNSNDQVIPSKTWHIAIIEESLEEGLIVKLTVTFTLTTAFVICQYLSC